MRGKLALALAAVLSSPAHSATITQIDTHSISFEGEIVEGDAEHLALEMAWVESRGRPIVALNSEGGSVQEATYVAAEIEKAEAAVIVTESGICVSACFFLFDAAKERYVVQGARIGVHSFRNAETEEENATSLAQTAEMARFLKDRGLPDSIITGMLTTKPGEIYWLTEADLTAMGVVFLDALKETPVTTIGCLRDVEPAQCDKALSAYSLQELEKFRQPVDQFWLKLPQD
jgi:hypothetical protein